MIELVVNLNKLSKSIIGVEPNLLSPLELLQEKFCVSLVDHDEPKNNVHQSHLPLIFRDEGVFNKICRVTIRQRDRVILPNISQVILFSPLFILVSHIQANMQNDLYLIALLLLQQK